MKNRNILDSKKMKEYLRDIKYYYARRELFEESSKIIGKGRTEDVIEMFNNVLYDIPIKLREVYFYLYVENNTFESLAFKLGVSYNYVMKLNKKLIDNLLKKINEKEDSKDESTKIFEKCK